MMERRRVGEILGELDMISCDPDETPARRAAARRAYLNAIGATRHVSVSPYVISEGNQRRSNGAGWSMHEEIVTGEGRA